MPAPLSHIKGLLLDLNGVFYVGNRALPGAAEAIAFLRQRQIPFRFITNNTTESAQTLCDTLNTMGIPVKDNEVINAPYAAVLYLRRMANPKCYLLLSSEVKQDFAEFTASEIDANVVVLGDMGNEWSYHTLNRAFRLLMQGADLIALHRAKYWQWEGGLHLDIGAFVTGLEYSTDKSALVVGKPSPSFFELALHELGLPAADVAVIGDDIDADVGGAQLAGMTGVLVKTGKYRDEFVANSPIQPDQVLSSIADIATLFDEA